MACPVENTLQSFLYGDLPDEEAEAVSNHIDDCEICDQVLRRLEESPDPVFGAVKSLALSGGHDIDAAAFHEHRQRLLDVHSDNAEAGELASDARNSDDTAFVPRKIGRYELQELLGRGGMGAVYKARHVKLNRWVAVKILPDSLLRSADAVARFEREMRAVGALKHPNIVHATDAAEVDGTHFIVMELVEGVDLSTLMKSAGRLSIADSCEIIRQAALGLRHAHKQGLVHRDVKPSNLLLSNDGVVKLLDLGLARISSEQADELTSTSQIMGTIDYMAPEQADNSHAADARADLYSLGATLFRLLTGVAPLDAHGCSTRVQKLSALLHRDQPDASQQRADLPDGLLKLLRQLLSRSPDDRPRSASDVAAALIPYCEGHSLAHLVAAVNAGDVGSATAQAYIETSTPSQHTLAEARDGESTRAAKAASGSGLGTR